MDSSLNFPQQDTPHKILYLLKVNGPKTVNELAKALAISSMGVRQHLKSLEGAGWIRHHQKQRGLGRPNFVYTLTEQGDEQHFPRTYASLMVSLLQAIQDLDGAAGLNRIFEKGTERLIAQYQERIISDELEERIKELASIRTEEGFMAEWEKQDEDTFVLRENNCALFQVARHCEQACISEQALFCGVLNGANVSRESHILSGDLQCTYVIQRKR